MEVTGSSQCVSVWLRLLDCCGKWERLTGKPINHTTLVAILIPDDNTSLRSQNILWLTFVALSFYSLFFYIRVNVIQWLQYPFLILTMNLMNVYNIVCSSSEYCYSVNIIQSFQLRICKWWVQMLLSCFIFKLSLIHIKFGQLDCVMCNNK